MMTIGFIVIFWYLDMNTKEPEIIFDPIIDFRQLPTAAPNALDVSVGYQAGADYPIGQPSDSDAPVSAAPEPTERPIDWNPITVPPDGEVDAIWYNGEFELPINGATGYAGVPLALRRLSDAGSELLHTLPAGKGFTILLESGDWWYIKLDDESGGWVEHRYCFVNLQDIIPSIVYNITNAYDSLYRSSGKIIPNVTHEELYSAYSHNARFGRHEFIVPAFYSTAKKLYHAQQAALADGNTLIIYEVFRPYDVQQDIGRGLRALAEADPDVNAGLNSGPWSIGSFVATLSNHQRGVAIDVSLGQVYDSAVLVTGDYYYVKVTDYQEYIMQSPMHELSVAAVLFKNSIRLSHISALRNTELSDSVTSETIKLLEYCMNAGLTPLASEWWHYDDLNGLQRSAASGINGRYRIDENYSAAPRNNTRDG